MAYELCTRSKQATSSAQTITALVLRCKKAKYDVRERERLRRRCELLGELTDKLETDKKRELDDLEERVASGEIGKVGAAEERAEIEKTAADKIGHLQTAFMISDPAELTKREVPDYLVDPITFEIMHDRMCFFPTSKESSVFLTATCSCYHEERQLLRTSYHHRAPETECNGPTHTRDSHH